MKLYKLLVDLVSTGTSKSNFYKNMNSTLKRLNGEYTMLHYPMEGKENQTFIEGQKNLTDFCISLLGEVGGKDLLEIGCGNGVQAKYIKEVGGLKFVTGVDLDEASIDIATQQQKEKNIKDMLFIVDDAQVLGSIDKESMDFVVSIESAFHYPDKDAFMQQVARVLKPGGKFLVADLLTTRRSKDAGVRKFWKGKMVHHHWNLERYHERFGESQLYVEDTLDITDRVLKGFEGYRKWISNIEKAGIIHDFFYKVFYIINAELIRHQLRRSMRYLVFVGNRS